MMLVENLSQRRKGMDVSRQLTIVISIILGIAILIVVSTGIVSGANTAKDAASSCPGFMSELSDTIGGGVDFC